jgi:hypothetical protein
MRWEEAKREGLGDASSHDRAGFTANQSGDLHEPPPKVMYLPAEGSRGQIWSATNILYTSTSWRLLIVSLMVSAISTDRALGTGHDHNAITSALEEQRLCSWCIHTDYGIAKQCLGCTVQLPE